MRAESWRTWSEGAEISAKSVPPASVNGKSVLRLSTAAAPGGVLQPVGLKTPSRVAASVWVLTRNGGVALRLEDESGQHSETAGTLVGSWEQLRLETSASSERYIFRIELDPDSEVLVAGADCIAVNDSGEATDDPAAMPPALQHGAVSGRVMHAGTPVSAGRIILAARRLRGDLQIAETVPGSDGRYAISYDWVGSRRPGLIVNLVDDAGVTVDAHELADDGDGNEVVDLEFDSAQKVAVPELVRLVSAVEPMLNGLRPSQLNVSDVDRLVQATGEDAARLRALINASGLANETGASTPVLYALLRDGSWEERLTTGRWTRSALGEAVDRAVGLGLVPQVGAEDIDEAVDKLRGWAVERVLQDGDTKALLSLAVPDDAVRARVVRQCLEHDGSPVELRTALSEDQGLAAPSDDLRYALRLAPLVAHDLTLISELLHRSRAGEPVSLENLAGHEPEQWEELLRTVAAEERPGDADADEPDELPARAAELARAFERAFPSAAFNQRASRHGGFASVPIAAFLKAHPDVDLGADDVAGVAAGDGADSDGGGAGGAHGDVRAMQRLYKVSSRYDDVAALHAAGFRSARAIARTGRAAFVREQAQTLGGEAAAGEVFERAAHISLAATGLVAEHGPAANTILPRVLQASAPADALDWEELFPNDQLSFAGVADWRSVFSPAAYLTDLFNFLDNVPSDVTGEKALDDLLNRRPDLQWLTLSAANTDVAMPYIDLVNELLESAVVAHAPDPVWVQGYPDAVQGALPAGATATPGDEGWQWVIDPASPGSTVTDAHAAPAASGQHEHGFTGATSPMNVSAGDLLVSWVYLDPANPPDEVMLQWTVGASDAEHRAYWTDLGDGDAPGIQLGGDGTASRRPMGGLPDLGRWARLVVPASAVALEGAQVTGMSFLVFTAADTDPATPRKGGAWWGSASCVANSPPVETQGTSDGLATTPQVITAAAYEPLSDSVYPPQVLPFDLGIETARTALNHLNVSRDQIMEALHPGSHAAALTDVDISTELLGLTPTERAILEATDGHTEAEHWGMTVDPANPQQWFKNLMVASEFLSRSGLRLDQMKTPPGAVSSYGFGLDFADPNNPSTLMVIGVSEQSLGLIRRFLRLWRKLGWAHGDLERVIHDVGPKDPVGKWPTILDPLLVTLAQMSRLQTMIGIAPLTTMSLWTAVLDGDGYVDVRTYPADGPLTEAQSPYFQLFLNNATGPPNQAFLLTADGSELADASQTVGSHTSDILAAVGITAEDLDRLANSPLSGLPAGPADISALKLNLGNLSALYRSAALAKATGLSVGDFLTLRSITAIDPFAAAKLRAAAPPVDPNGQPILQAQANTVELVEALNDVRGSNLSLSELQYVLAHVVEPGETGRPTEEQLATVLADLQGVLVPMVNAHQPAPDPTGALALSELSALPGLTGTGAAVAALNATLVTSTGLADLPTALVSAPGGVEGSSNGQLTYDEDSKQLSFIKGAMTAVDHGKLRGLSNDPAYETAIDSLFDASRAPVAALLSQLLLTAPTEPDLIDTLSDPGARFAKLLGPVTTLVQQTLGELLVVNKVSTAVGIDAQLCPHLLIDWLHVAASGSMSAMTALLALGDGQPIAGHGSAHDALVKCFKVGQLITAFGLSRAETTHAFTIGSKHGWIDLDKLPVTAGKADFAGWQQLARYVQLRNTLADTTGVLIGLFADADKVTGAPTAGAPEEVVQQLNDAFGWPAGVVDDAASALSLQYPTAFLNQEGITRLHRVVEIAATAGANVAWLKTIATNPLAAADGLAAWPVLAAHYDPTTWDSIGAGLQDTLRESRRDALVGYLSANPAKLGITDTTEILPDRMLERLLVDVEMGSCRPSTRLDLAINSVQLYVQRCQLGLEPNVTLTPEDLTEWGWLGDYQDWAAARRTFIYPENYLDPTLRADVTEMFTALQKQLLQADLTSDAAEDALLTYLDGLDEIANLEPAAVVRDMSLAETTTNESGTTTTTQTLTLGDTHLISRTRSSPHLYYHRGYDPTTGFTPWQKINVDIDADNLLPGILNGQLYLFWPQFLDTAEQTLPTGASGQLPTKSRQLSLAWTRLRNGQWAPKQVASGPALDQGAHTYSLELGNFSLRGDNLRALKYPSDGYAIAAYWYLPGAPSSSSAWSFAFPGAFTFSPGSLTVEVQEPLAPPSPTYEIIPHGFGFAPGTYYFVVTVIASGSYESAPSPEVSVVVPPDQSDLALSWPVTTDIPVTYRLYIGSASRQENAYWEVTPAPGGTSASVYINDVVKPDGSGTPPPATSWQSSPPQSGVTPAYQGYDVSPTANLTLGIVSPDPTSGWTGSSAITLAKVDPVTRVLASPLQTDSQAPPISGFIPLFGLCLEMGERSFCVIQQPPLPPVHWTVPTSAAPALAAAHGTNVPEAAQPSADGSHPAAASLRSAIRRAFGSGTVSSAAPITGALAAVAQPADDRAPQAQFLPTYHPWVKLMIAELNLFGVPGLLRRDLQLNPEAIVQPPVTAFDFKSYLPDAGATATPYPADDIDFAPGGAYSTYNWELFFHIPLLIAKGLMHNQRFADAQAWLHYIFDPTDASTNPAPQKYWQTGSLFNYFQAPDPSVTSLLNLLAASTGASGDPRGAENQIAVWRADPSDPDALARLRLSAYQKAVVMTYLDNLIAWGDSLFSQGTAETITRATQLYVLASQLLGPAPDLGTFGKEPRPYSLAEVRGKLDGFSDPVVNVENQLAVWTTPPNSPPGFEPAPVATLTSTLYFGVPVNDKLVSYWPTVEDRLSKIRHCLDIQGQPATTPEFGAPVPPGAPITAALGFSGSDGGFPAALPQYRFATLMQKALELCGEVKALGGALLSAIEKRDAEALARIRSGQEVQVLQAAREVKQRQIDDATQAITVLERQQSVTFARQQYYLSRPFLNDQENQQLGHLQTAALLQTLGQGYEVLGAALSLIPQFDIGLAGVMGSPLVNASFGGQQLSEVTQVFSRLYSLLASVESHQANMAGLMGGFFRRRDDWSFQAGQAALELQQIQAQIAGAQIRQDIARKELANHDLQIGNAQTVDAFLISKFSNTELYEWMIGQVSAVYFQAYQLALDMARRAELAYQHELGVYSTSFVQSGYWNSLSKGLLAGEQLSYDLHRMETSYLENNRREFELTKHISLALVDPESLLQLRQTGECFIEVPEALFDLDYPGHYMRRMKSVAVTVPCVTGPFGGVNCTLTMTQNSVRLKPDLTGGYAYQGYQDPRFSDQIAGAQSIVTSGGQADAGLFEANLRDERYLPFEGAGAISRWHVQLPVETNRIRRDSITDFVLHVRYTARDGGPTLHDAAMSAIVETFYKQGVRLLSLRQNLTDRWAQYSSWAASAPTTPLTMTVELTADLFPAQAPPNIGIESLRLLMLTAAALPPNPTISVSSPSAAAAVSVTFTPNPALGGVPQGGTPDYNPVQPLGQWSLAFPAELAALNVSDVIVITHYATAG